MLACVSDSCKCAPGTRTREGKTRRGVHEKTKCISCFWISPCFTNAMNLGQLFMFKLHDLFVKWQPEETTQERDPFAGFGTNKSFLFGRRTRVEVHQWHNHLVCPERPNRPRRIVSIKSPIAFVKCNFILLQSFN
mmetsp:Transcript_20237/g.28466  ORF Transcript_20237/g.28466 Transcript_20237/m.28466 type:complete len:135 (-) Transcript_20237:510-914(-)